MKNSILLMTAIVGGLSALVVGQQPSAPSKSEVVIDSCYMWRDDYYDREISAQDAGLLTVMNLREGDPVKKGELLAQLDTTDAEMRRDVALFRRNKADVEAKNPIRTEFAKAQYEVSKQEYENAYDANVKAQKYIFSAGDLRQRKLQMVQAELQIENEKFNSELAALEVKVQDAEVKAANKAIERHRIVAPFDGQIDEVYRKANEWAQAGEPILKLVRYDEMMVGGRVSVKDYDPAEIKGRKVTVQVPLAHSKTETLTGEIVFVGYDATVKDSFEVRARVANRRQGGLEDGRWVLFHGPKVKMTIHLK